MSTETSGVVFFNFGEQCGLRLLISMYSMRKYYNGDAILLLANGDKYNDRLKEEAKKIGVDVDFYDLNKICNKNLKSVMAPKALKISPFTSSIQIDADTVFRDSPEFILNKCSEYGVFVSNFCNWVSTGSIMRKRIESFSDLISISDLKESLNNKPAINCGVVGYKKGVGDDFLKEWNNLTDAAAGRFIAEEIACQCVYWKYKNYIAPAEWNSSCLWGDIDTAKIIHYHGHKHTSPNRPSSRYWWAEVGWALEDEKITKDTLDFWTQYDKNAKEILENEGKLIIEDSKEEFSEKRVNKIICN